MIRTYAALAAISLALALGTLASATTRLAHA